MNQKRTQGGRFAGRSAQFGAGLLAVSLLTAGLVTASASGSSAYPSVAKYMLAPKTITQTVPLKTRPAKGKSIVEISNSVPASTQIQQAMVEAAKAVGWKYTEVSYDPNNPATIQQAFATALVKHPTVVEIGGPATDLYGSNTVKEFAKAHIPIIVDSTYPVITNKTLLGTVNSVANPELAGKVLADWFAADSNGTGNALLVHWEPFPLLEGFETGFDLESASVCQTCTDSTLDISGAELAAGQTVSTVVSYLQAHPSIGYVFFDLGNEADGVTSALAAAGLTSVKVGGQGIDADGAAALAAGTESVWTATSNYYTGYANVDFALRWSEHMSTAGDSTSPFQLLTAANIKGVTNWNAPYNALAQFEKLWKVPVTKCTVACS